MIPVYGGGQSVFLTRSVEAIQIPEGITRVLEKDSQVYITQVLGGMFTVETGMGFLARVDGKDADALGQPVPTECLEDENFDSLSLSEKVWAKLRTCYDPEIPVNVVDLGLIYDCQIAEGSDETCDVSIKMTLTAPGCGMGEVLTKDVENRAKEVVGVKDVEIELVFDPPWDNDRMSEAARLQLGLM